MLTRRRRRPGHEWAIIRLAGRGPVRRLEIDTTGLIGNAAHSVGVQAADAPGATPKNLRKAEWIPMLSPTRYKADTVVTYTELETTGEVTHLRLDLHPDDGVTRFRAFGMSEEPWML